MSDPEVEYVVRGYPKDGKFVADEAVLKNITVEELRRIFDQPDDEPMVDVFPVGEHEAELLRAFLPRAIDVKTLNYFLYCDAL